MNSLVKIIETFGRIVNYVVKKGKEKKKDLKSTYIGVITITILYSRRPQNCTYIVDTLGLVNFTDENHELKQTWSRAFVV